MGWIWAFVLGWLASFTASAVYAWGMTPSLDIRTEPGTTKHIGRRDGHPEHRFLQLEVENKQAPLPWRWFTERNTAWACEVFLDFYHADRPSEKAIADTVIARWSSTPELIQPVILPTNVGINGQPAMRIGAIPDLTKLPYGRRMDLHSGTPEAIALVVKIEGQSQCYVFSNESYLLGWENKNWQLDAGKYRIVAEIRSGRSRKRKTFSLNNEGQQLDSVVVSPYK